MNSETEQVQAEVGTLRAALDALDEQIAALQRERLQVVFRFSLALDKAAKIERPEVKHVAGIRQF